MLADVLTLRDCVTRPLEDVVLCYLGDGRNNTARSLLVTMALLGGDFRLASPLGLQPDGEARGIAEALASVSGARITVTDDVASAIEGADALYTDVWVSMGEPTESWAERVDALRDYRISSDTIAATGNPRCVLMHCLPALHDRGTEIGEWMFERFGLNGVEVADDVFESAASVVFDQSENRLHTMKSLVLSTLGC
jgi:ornithine carbamoyltransferase